MPPDLSFWLELLFKMTLTAGVVVFISLVVERSGPFIGALVAALPTAGGAAYVILAIEHPPAFIAGSAVGSMAIGAAVAIFAAVYAVLAQRHGLLLSLGVSLLVWFACAALLRQYDWTPLSALVLNAAVYAVTVPLSWRYRSSAPPKRFLRTRYDIPLRALAAAIVVVVVTSASHSIGSFASGMFALFPIVFCSSIVILHPRVGGQATASVMAHAQVALIGLTFAFMAVHFFAEPLGSWWALLIGLGVSVAWSGMLMAVRRRGKAR
ncbi:MAG: hypothetical protein ACTHJS_07610 [Xanthobacteraceae bacterium]|jgi:uncharacterized membrane protein (GlpM family)